MFKIRPFIKTDRKVLRQICCDVADHGNPIEGFFYDREFAADLLTSYYLDYEPESSFIAEIDQKVIGYINGCLDNRRYGLVLIFLIVPNVFIKGFCRGVFFHSNSWNLLKGILKNWPRLFTWRKKSFHSHQGHMHIGLIQSARGLQIGKRLVETLVEYAKSSEITEITASVHSENIAACRFFEDLGFVEENRYPMVMMYGNLLKRYFSIFYVKKIV